MNLKELYQEIILEHGKNPRNLRKTEGFNKDAKGNNPLCGCLLYTSPSPRDLAVSRMPSSA